MLSPLIYDDLQGAENLAKTLNSHFATKCLHESILYIPINWIEKWLTGMSQYMISDIYEWSIHWNI